MTKTRKNILKQIGLVILIIGMSMVMAPVSATFFIEDGSEIDKDGLLELISGEAPEYAEDAVVFFYDPGCGACTPAHEFLLEYIEEQPDTKVQLLDLSNSTEERDRFNELKKQFNRQTVYTPVLYIGPVAVEGYTEIMENFEDVYSWYTPEE